MSLDYFKTAVPSRFNSASAECDDSDGNDDKNENDVRYTTVYNPTQTLEIQKLLLLCQRGLSQVMNYIRFLLLIKKIFTVILYFMPCMQT